ncbi:hypothetical protein [Streptomyces yunnanensis]|uniref:Uncharacterized protein n=1 Tax=Streptomyces yunnanensis TaxID=156453 RepID=A0A9X8QUE2_9ACTN|nr:hypothetical protein [Streptomyces yunnanensis]SHM19470.1 hypothetical protein SAMN05216268_10977 [Streptomyces yunnanensis]
MLATTVLANFGYRRGGYREAVRDERHYEPLSGEELELFLQYLHRFARHDVDLYALMEVGDPADPRYMALTSEPAPGVDRSAYRRP